MRILITLPLLLLASKPQLQEDSKSLLEQVRSKYSSYKMVEMDVQRKTHLAVLDRTREADLKIFVSDQGEIRLEVLEEPKSITLLTNNKVQVLDYPDPFFGGPHRLLVSKDASLKNSQSFLMVLFGRGDLSTYYKVNNVSGNSYELLSVRDEITAKKVVLDLDPKNKQIKKITYWDEMNNRVELVIEKSIFKKSRSKSVFELKIPKDTEITEI